MRVLHTLLAIVVLASSAKAQTIAGTIQIDRKLTKRSVTADVPIYQRGTVAKLGKAPDEDPLDFERSRVVVYLEGTPTTASAPVHSASFVMQQVDRGFAPDMLVVPAGATVTFPNMDPVFHNIFSLSKAKMFDLGSYDKGESRKVNFPKPGVVYVYCHLHPNMAAAIVVTPNRWYARSDASGHFEIRDVPPGKYTIVAWHKAVGFLKKEIVVENGHNAAINFILPLTEEEQQHSSSMKAESASLTGSR